MKEIYFYNDGFSVYFENKLIEEYKYDKYSTKFIAKKLMIYGTNDYKFVDCIL